MAIICPKCGREFLGQRDKCPVCGCATVDDSGIDNSEAARKQRLQKLQEQKLRQVMAQTEQPKMQSRQIQAHSQSKVQNSEQKSIVTKKKYKTSTLIIIAVSLIVLIGILNGGKKDDSKRQTVSNQESHIEDIIQENNHRDNDVESIEVENYEEQSNITETLTFDEEIVRFSSGEYLFITNDDLSKYCSNMEGVKVYVVTDIDDIKNGMIQSTLSDGYMMSGFDVGNNYSRYESGLKIGDLVAICGTVSGYNDYGFMGNYVSLNDCEVFAAGDNALSYKREVSDGGLSKYFVVTETVADSNKNDMSETDFKSLCQTLNYEDILRNPDLYKGNYCVLSGTVDQIIEGWFGSFSIFINDYSGNKWGCVYSYKDGESHLLEGDNVTVYGKCEGTDTSRTVLGQQVTMPRIDIEYIN